jgi:hypothetical protein
LPGQTKPTGCYRNRGAHATRGARNRRARRAKYARKGLEEVPQAAAQGKLDPPVARTVRLSEGIDALTELERRHTPKGGKLVIVPQ